jgi:hypothetical protein
VGSYVYKSGLGGNWNKAPRPEYKYSLRLPSPFPKDPPDVHPLLVYFNGTPSRISLDEQWAPTDKIGQFFKRVVQTYRTGSREEWLALWTPKAREFWSGNSQALKDTYQMERQQFSGEHVQWIFTIDFGSSAAVFFINKSDKTNQDKKDKEPVFIHHLVIWKGEGEYRLTQGETLRSGQQTFIGNLHSFFDAQPFQDAVRSIVEKAFPLSNTANP